jgi:threonine aldolase
VDSATFAAAARERGVLVSVLGPRSGRLLTHLDVDDAGIEQAIEVLTAILRG